VSDGLLSLLQASLIAHGIPGAALAQVASDGSMDVHGVGRRSASSDALVDADTVFEGASFSKPCFALALLRLARAGAFPLDEPLQPYSENLRGLGAAASTITARHLLSHTSGLPNWRSESRSFRVWFPPGERFSYSSEGYVCLQQAAEAICAKSAEQLAQELVFEPLRMQRTSYVWQSRFDDNHALPHDGAQAPELKSKPALPNASASLHTTAADYALFLRALLSEPLASQFEPVIAVPAQSPISLDAPTTLHAELWWGLGWGLVPASSLFLHWGANPGFRALVVGSLKEQRAIAVFTNADGLRAAADVVLSVFPAAEPVRAWLGLS
jgi:CubicO group peptidase (beta-lactamase class C family)